MASSGETIDMRSLTQEELSELNWPTDCRSYEHLSEIGPSFTLQHLPCFVIFFVAFFPVLLWGVLPCLLTCGVRMVFQGRV